MSLAPFNALRRLTARLTVRQVLIVSAGNIFGNGLTMAAMLLIAHNHNMSTAAYGVFGAIYYTMAMLAQFSDFGINTTIVKYYREAEEAGRPEEAEALLRITLWIRLAVVGSIAGIVAIAAVPISGFLFRDEAIAPLLRLACIGAVGSSLWMFSQGAMQARRQFTSFAVLTTLNHALRFLAIIVLIVIDRITVGFVVIVNVIVPFAGVACSIYLFPYRFWTAKIDRNRLRERVAVVVHLSKWIFFSTIVCTVIMRLDIYLLENLSTQGEVGQYSFALNLAQGLMLVTTALATVLLPKLSVTRSRGAMLETLRAMIKSVPWLLIAVAGLMAIVHIGAPLFKQGAYARSAWVFDMLAISFAIAAVVSPISFFCLAFERARWLTWMNLIQLGISFTAGVLLIPRYGAIGSGISSLLVYGFALVYLTVVFRRLLRMAEETRGTSKDQEA